MTGISLHFVFVATHLVVVKFLRRVWLHLLYKHPLSGCKQRWGLSLIFSRLSRPSSLSLSLYIVCYSPRHFELPQFASTRGIQNWTWCSRCGLRSALQRRIITFLSLLATCFLMQPNMQFIAARVHCWLCMFCTDHGHPTSVTNQLDRKQLSLQALHLQQCDRTSLSMVPFRVCLDCPGDMQSRFRWLLMKDYA